MKLLNELLELQDTLLTERIDNMLDRLNFHFSNIDNSNPGKIFSKDDIELTSYQLAGLQFILDCDNLEEKIPEFSDSRLAFAFFNELDEPKERKLFSDRTRTASEFLSDIGKKYNKAVAKTLLKQFESLKSSKNIATNSEAILRLVNQLQSKLGKLKNARTVK